MKTPFIKRTTLAALLLTSTVVLQGCPNPYSADVYTAQSAQREQSVRMGVIETVRPVKIQSNSGSGIGTIGGALAGGVAGSTIGGGRGSTLAAVGGALAGAALGSGLQKGIANSNGVEITVRLDDGTLRAITQAATKEVFRVGERVRLLTTNGITRVTH